MDEYFLMLVEAALDDWNIQLLCSFARGMIARRDDDGPGARVFEIEAEFLNLVTGIERRRNGPRPRRRQERDEVLEVIAQHDADRVARLNAVFAQRRGDVVDLLFEL